jgi:hypothetical protein
MQALTRRLASAARATQVGAVIGACVQTGLSAGGAATIQSADEREQGSGSSPHDPDLRVVEAKPLGWLGPPALGGLDAVPRTGS